MTFLDFCDTYLPEVIRGWEPHLFHSVLAGLIEGLEGQSIALSTPPQHGKTVLAVVGYSSWRLYCDPSVRIIYCSYSKDLVLTKIPLISRILKEAGVEVEVDTAGRIQTPQGGGIDGVGIGGSVTGKTADVLILDDLVKNIEDVMTSHRRQKTWDFFDSVLRTRVSEDATIVSIGTRWHMDDFQGRFMDEADVSLNFPALALESDILKRNRGASLCEEIKPLAFIEGQKARMRKDWFSALYQGNPVSSEGGYFKKEDFAYWTQSGGLMVYRRQGVEQRAVFREMEVVQVVDTQYGSETGSFFVVMTVALYEGCVFVLDIVRTRVKTTEHEGILADARRKWSPAYQAIESQGAGIVLIQLLQSKGLSVKELKANQSKEMRAEVASAAYEHTKVFHPDCRGWVDDLEDELLDFPAGKRDDQVDCISYACRLALKGEARTSVRSNPALRGLTQRRR